MLKSRKHPGFTLIELLIVIVVIAILAAISVVAYSGIQARARDSIRKQDMAAIEKAIKMYSIDHGGSRATLSTPRYNLKTGLASRGGWDTSVDDEWLDFLRDDYGPMPVDPINKLGEGSLNPNSSGFGHRSYFYFCYEPHSADPYVRIGYFDERDTKVTIDIPVSDCV